MALDKAIDSAQLDAELTAVANAIRAKGGTSDLLAFPSGFVEAVGAILAGSVSLPYEGAESPMGWQNLFDAISKGTTHNGEFTLSSFLSGSTEHLILDTGFTYVKGILILNVDWNMDNPPSTNDSLVFAMALYTDGLNETVRYSVTGNKYTVVSNLNNSTSSWITRCSSLRWDSGKLYITPQFGGSSYPPLYAGHRHIWIAWGDK